MTSVDYSAYTAHALRIPLDEYLDYNQHYDIIELYWLLHCVVVDPVHLEELHQVKCGTPDLISRRMDRALFRDGCGWYDHKKGLVLYCIEYTTSGLEWILEPLSDAMDELAD